MVDGRVQFTNNHWVITESELCKSFDTEHASLLNDFEAIAYSVPFIGEQELHPIGLPDRVSLEAGDFVVGIIGPGTGLGAAGLIRFGDTLLPIVGEGSHGGFAPETKLQLDVLTQLRERFDRVSSERLVSGQGLENTYWALSQIHGEKNPQLSAAEIFERNREGNDPRAVEAVGLFFEMLGQVAGDLALTLGAEQGVFVAGGIAQRYPDLLAASRFRSAFEAKGRHRALMEHIPTQLITHPQPGLLGAAYFARKLLQDST